MGFADTLAGIANRIDGCAAVLILGIDGIPIDRHVRDIDPAIDIDAIAAEFTTLVKRGMRTAASAELGEMREMMLASDLMTFLLRPITPEYFLLLALNPGGN